MLFCFLIFFLKKYLFFNWRIIALQIFTVFCQISTWISHRLFFKRFINVEERLWKHLRLQTAKQTWWLNVISSPRLNPIPAGEKCYKRLSRSAYKLEYRLQIKLKYQCQFCVDDYCGYVRVYPYSSEVHTRVLDISYPQML